MEETSPPLTAVAARLRRCEACRALLGQLKELRSRIIATRSPEEACPPGLDPMAQIAAVPFERTSTGFLQRIHRMVEEADHCGTYRDIDVAVPKGPRVAVRFCSPGNIHLRLRGLLDFVRRDPLPAPLLGALALAEFLDIHPFYDGNGRAGRLWTNILLIQNDYPPFRLTESARGEYGTTLARYSLEGDPEPFARFYLRQLIEGGNQILSG